MECTWHAGNLFLDDQQHSNLRNRVETPEAGAAGIPAGMGIPSPFHRGGAAVLLLKQQLG